MDQTLRTALSDAFRVQAKICRRGVAAVSAAILDGCADEIAAGSVLDPVLAGWSDPRLDTALALRVLAAVHRLVLDGRAPELATVCPSAGGTADPDRAWPLARKVIAEQGDFITSYLDRPPQTNEVGRSAMLLGGFLTIAHVIGLPMRLLELAASGGLNLFWDQYRVETPVFGWGPKDASLVLRCAWEGSAPPLPARIEIASRAACDRNPVDLRNPDDIRRLESYVWTDQLHRFERLRKAIAVARANNVAIDRESADIWLARQLTTLPEGVVSVVYHSVFWTYLPDDIRNALCATINDAGRRATSKSPLAWLRMEMRDMKAMPELTLTLWPGGKTHDLATVHFHGDFVKWRA